MTEPGIVQQDDPFRLQVTFEALWGKAVQGDAYDPNCHFPNNTAKPKRLAAK